MSEHIMNMYETKKCEIPPQVSKSFPHISLTYLMSSLCIYSSQDREETGVAKPLTASVHMDEIVQ